ncbi:MAG: hypothetical protein IT320_00600 [Anaerolineae bacterium]|nr:hypothetical protein [Anaerolineae bacterium]
MTEFHHDPDSLADQLDRLLPPDQPDQIGTDGGPLTEAAARLASAPHPTLSPDAMARIQSQMMQTQPPPQYQVRLAALRRLATAAALFVLVIAGTLYAARELGITLVAPAMSTLVNTPVNTAPAAATISTPITPAPVASEIVVTQVTPTVGQSPPPTDVPTAAPSVTVPAVATSTLVPIVPTPTESLPPTALPPPATVIPTALPAVIIVEGPVQSIDENIITIFNVDITLDANDPVLSVLQVGDVVRAEGEAVAGANTLMVMAASVAIIDLEVFIDPDGAIWRDPGDCSNPPPAAAPAPDWRARCESTGGSGSSSGDGTGGGSPPPDGGTGGATPPPEGDGGSAPPPDHPDTVVICHHAPGESGQQQTITVSWDAWVNAHSGHGDTLGPCQ